jgi:glutamyl-tRNA synthetase
MPTYHFATVIDDHDYGINYVIRGHDHITNTSRQIAIYNTLGWSIPKYAHVGLLAANKKPLSKRDRASSILAYKQKGYHPEAMLNFMARLGWGPTVDDKTTKLLPREKMLELFLEGGKMKNSLANIDLDKLDSFDRKYKARNV